MQPRIMAGIFHIFGAIAEFERQLIRERTQAGLRAARARGRLGGRRSVIAEDKLGVARAMIASGEYTMQQIADTIGVGRATLYRHLPSDARAARGASPVRARPDTFASGLSSAEVIGPASAAQRPARALTAAGRRDVQQLSGIGGVQRPAHEDRSHRHRGHRQGIDQRSFGIRRRALAQDPPGRCCQSRADDPDTATARAALPPRHPHVTSAPGRGLTQL